MAKKAKYVKLVRRYEGYVVLNRKTNDLLAVIDYYPGWKQYVARFKPDCIFSSECLNDIARFCDNPKSCLEG